MQPQIIVTPPEITFTGSFEKGLLHIRDEFVDPEGEIATDLEELPKEVDFSEKLGKKIFYHSEEKLLILKGAINEKEFETLISLSAERDYQKAITALFARGRDWVESIVGYSQNELLTNKKLFFQCIYAEDVEKVLSFMRNPSGKQIDFRFLHREGQVIDFSLGVSEINQSLDGMPEDLSFSRNAFKKNFLMMNKGRY